MSLARFSLKYTTYFPMGIYVYGDMYSRFSSHMLKDAIRVQYEWGTYSVTVVSTVVLRTLPC